MNAGYNGNLDDKLHALRYCIVQESDEDALEHCFDLIRAIRLRRHLSAELTREGKVCKGLLQPRAESSHN